MSQPVLESSGVDSQPSPNFSTPTQLRGRRLEILKGEPSPLHKVPPSPAMQRLGYGTGVGVYLLERSPKPTGEIRSPWAVKKISRLMKKGDVEVYKRRLAFEASILKELKHPNIIGFRGYLNPQADSAFLAMEKASKSLTDLIDERNEETLSPEPFPAPNIVKVALDVARALQYLHLEKKLIHGDLKSANVLVVGDFVVCKVCDFGVSRRIKEDGSIEGRYVGTEIWNPKEVLRMNRGEKPIKAVTAKADIYPYGLTLHEMMSLKPPHFGTAEDDYEDGTDQSDEFNEDAFDKALQRQLGKRPALPDFPFDDSYNIVLGVFYCCTEEDPEERPTAEQILLMLDDADIPSKP